MVPVLPKISFNFLFIISITHFVRGRVASESRIIKIYLLVKLCFVPCPAINRFKHGPFFILISKIFLEHPVRVMLTKITTATFVKPRDQKIKSSRLRKIGGLTGTWAILCILNSNSIFFYSSVTRQTSARSVRPSSAFKSPSCCMVTMPASTANFLI